jgi:N-acyl-D-amino-acid deacylase
MIRFAAPLMGVLLVGASPPPPTYDIVIRGGRVLDGAGNPWIAADVAIKDGMIVRIGKVSEKGSREIDAAGRYVSPGFIDMMDQSGGVLLRNGGAENKLRMGVTTLIAGEGGTPVPAAEIPAYFKRLETGGIAVNFGTYYSAAQARVKVMGDAAGTPTDAQLTAMEVEVTAAMRAGAFGITTALIYPPNSFQSTADLIRLAKIPGRCGGFYASHMRDESSELLTAVGEAIEIGEKSGAKVEIFHIKAAYAPGWGTIMPKALALIDAARARGVDIAADLYPYRAGGTGLEVTVPAHVFRKGRAEALKQLADPAVRVQLKKEVAAGPQPDWSNLVDASGGWKNVVLANGFNPKYVLYHGKNFAEIGKAMGRDPADVAWDIMVEAMPKRAMALYFMMDERDIELAMKRPWTSIGTDAAAAEKPGEVDALGLPHPRAYGTFPRVIAEYAVKRGVLSLEDAVRKMTSWPAQRMGFSDRGVLREGLRADIVVFDLKTIRDVADWPNPTAYPTGIGEVIVNGQLALSGGQPTGARGGRVLRHSCDLRM